MRSAVQSILLRKGALPLSVVGAGCSAGGVVAGQLAAGRRAGKGPKYAVNRQSSSRLET